jgi:hypothetical protein
MFKIKKKILFKTAEHNVNKLILVLGIFLLTITALIMANTKGWIALNPGILATIKIISIILWTFFIASVFIKFTHNRVHKLFDESVDVEQRILLSKFYTFFVYLFATAFVLWKWELPLKILHYLLDLLLQDLLLP